MTNNTDQSTTLGASQQWKNRCLSLLKEREKWELSAQGPQSKTTDLLKKKEEEELNLRLTQNKIQELENQLNELNSEVSNAPQIKSEVIQLFKHSTKLIFDQESSPTEIKGSVLGGSLKTFRIDTTKHSQQYIASYLWQLIDKDLK